MPAECPSDHALSDFVTGELSPPDSTAVSNHLKSCADCVTRVRGLELSVTDPLLDDLRRKPPDAPSDPEFREALNRLLTAPPGGPALPRVGDVLDDYKLVEILGEGGMGVVYRAIHTRLDKEVALKVIRRSRVLDPRSVERFGREMKAAGKVRHANLVQATDAGVTGEVPYLVMEYVHGTDLARLVLRDGPLSCDRACDVIRQAAVGLHHAHEHGLVHRDVKPSNLILGSDGTVRVLDLGLALLPGDAPESEAPDTDSVPDGTLTSPGQQLGTRHYVAPEQLVDSHRVDPRADVYGLGCTLVYLITGHPYTRGEPFPPQLPVELWKKLLAPFPDDRLPSAAAVADAMAPHCHRAAQALPRRRRGWLLATCVIAAAVVVGIILLTQDREPAAGDPQPDSTPSPTLVAQAPAPRWALPRGTIPMTGNESLLLQKQHADRLGQPVVLKNSLGMDMVLIPPGEFGMSATYSVTLTKPFRIATFEVTNGQFKQFVADTRYQTDAEAKRVKHAAYFNFPPSQAPPRSKPPYHRLNPGWGDYKDDQPIVYLTWEDATLFLRWLSEREGRTYRLPTHAEWAWACRAGTATKFYWGNDVMETSKYAWMRWSNADRPQPVGLLTPNTWGLYDILGNVSEMVQDFESIPVPVGRATDPTGPENGTFRIACGGNYTSLADFGRDILPASSYQMNFVDSARGFRVVLEP